ncbi:hypothetical protein UFOVP697_28 [uncultured Caudovirales phage]|uniref:Uncharacterized protein n=1 Tax=uncultured Caudovirales phage TaxID=2100421 RepID=A0A6J5NT21_9CAUD|nr:hypothetical protein UFOVP427_10 [uncultured Caudovirales phage]CAB4158314.1 hypothetical protein UFOVP697_28 [uncultured Caudovirales phage]
MINTKSQIEIKEIVVNETIKGTILIVKEQNLIGGGINQTKEDNTIYEASIIYEF